MLTDKQIKWLNHLSDNNHTKIVPYNPEVKKIFLKVKQDILSYLGKDIEVFHKGATSLGISGKGDIDIYLPVISSEFDVYYLKLKDYLGQPGSFYPLERVRWNKIVEGFEVEIFLINKNHSAWKDSVLFENYLLNHPESLEEYRILKEKAEGSSTREYYRRKIEFINKILNKAKSS